MEILTNWERPVSQSVCRVGRVIYQPNAEFKRTTMLTIILICSWFLVATFICSKRNWYKNYNYLSREGEIWAVIATYLFTPFVFIIVLVKEFLVREWGDGK